MRAIMALLAKFRLDMTIACQQEFVYSFFPFLFGIYPYTVVTKKQEEAMAKANVNYIHNTIYQLAYSAVRKLLE